MTISSTGKDMLIQFLTDDHIVWAGFRAYFHYIPIEPNCANWWNLTAQLLKSPDYPTINCSWVITAPLIDDNIIIHFETFEVKCSSYLISHYGFLAGPGFLISGFWLFPAFQNMIIQHYPAYIGPTISPTQP